MIKFWIPNYSKLDWVALFLLVIWLDMRPLHLFTLQPEGMLGMVTSQVSIVTAHSSQHTPQEVVASAVFMVIFIAMTQHLYPILTCHCKYSDLTVISMCTVLLLTAVKLSISSTFRPSHVGMDSYRDSTNVGLRLASTLSSDRGRFKVLH